MNHQITPVLRLALEAVDYELKLLAEQQQLLALNDNQEYLKQFTRPQLILLLLTVRISYREGNYSWLHYQIICRNIMSRIKELS